MVAYRRTTYLAIASASALVFPLACGDSASSDAPDGGVSTQDAARADAPPPAPADVSDAGSALADAALDAASDAAAGDAAAGYDDTVLADHPVAYWAMRSPSSTEPDLTGNGHAGTYQGGQPAQASLPNGDRAAAFDGATQYMTVPSHASFSIPTTGHFTWEAWIRPDVLQFPHDGDAGYVDWMGKCAEYSPTCEWEVRMYDTTNSQGRCNRLSAYVFNPTAGLGSGADWQPTCGLFQPGQWFHVVGEYSTLEQPADCTEPSSYPGSINIWVDGVSWNHAQHGQTGCMSQYKVVPQANNSPVNIGTMAKDGWFQGAIAKVALYGDLLTPVQIAEHYQVMTGQAPSGSCANTCSF